MLDRNIERCLAKGAIYACIFSNIITKLVTCTRYASNGKSCFYKDFSSQLMINPPGQLLKSKIP